MIPRQFAPTLVAVFFLPFAQAQDPVSDVSPSIENNGAPAPHNLPIVAELQSVKAVAANGKLERFADSANREFAIGYNSEGKVVAVGAVRGRHFSDIQRIVYSPTGQIMEVNFGSGYALHFVYADDGTQIIRDRYGGVFTRGNSSGRGKLHSDPTGKLQSTIAGLDAILAAAQQ